MNGYAGVFVRKMDGVDGKPNTESNTYLEKITLASNTSGISWKSVMKKESALTGYIKWLTERLWGAIMKFRVFCSCGWFDGGFWSFAPFVIYGGQGCFGVGFCGITFEWNDQF